MTHARGSRMMGNIEQRLRCLCELFLGSFGMSHFLRMCPTVMPLEGDEIYVRDLTTDVRAEYTLVLLAPC